MATKTQTELIQATLEELLVIGNGETPTAEESDVVERRIVPLLDDLSLRGVVHVPDPDEIEAAVFRHLVPLLAQDCAPSFGKRADYSVLAYAEDQLRTITSRVDVDSRLTFDSRLPGLWR